MDYLLSQDQRCVVQDRRRFHTSLRYSELPVIQDSSKSYKPSLQWNLIGFSMTSRFVDIYLQVRGTSKRR